MTLIAGFMREGCPILMGDILISNRLEFAKDLTIPTIGRVSSDDLKNGIYQPTAFSQKINLLSPQLALAWSGNLLEAKNFMTQVIGANLHNNPSREAIIEIFNDSAPDDLYVIGLLRDGKNLTLFDINCEKVDLQDSRFSWFKAGGTGYHRLTNTISEINSKLTSGTLNKLENGISAALQISTSLLSLELQTGTTLHELFGAGYEILYPLGSGLSKFTDLTYYFWSAEERSAGKWYLSTPFLAMKYSYHKDILIIRCARLSRNSNNRTMAIKIESDELHIIMPIYRMVSDDELIGYDPTSLNSKFVCNTFLCKNSREELSAFSTLGRYVNETPPVIWDNEFRPNGGINISSKFLHETMNKITSSFITA